MISEGGSFRNYRFCMLMIWKVMSETRKDLQKRLTERQESLHMDEMKVNFGKSEVLVSSRKKGERLSVQDKRCLRS